MNILPKFVKKMRDISGNTGNHFLKTKKSMGHVTAFFLFFYFLKAFGID